MERRFRLFVPVRSVINHKVKPASKIGFDDLVKPANVNLQRAAILLARSALFEAFALKHHVVVKFRSEDFSLLPPSS
ncbi:hypothetical protein [Bradyrhizobium sp.]